MTVESIINKLGWKKLAAELGVGRTAIVNAKASGRFPAAWYQVVRDLCDAESIALDEDLFSWRSTPPNVDPVGAPK